MINNSQEKALQIMNFQTKHMEKKYLVNETLIKIFQKNGLFEISTEEDKKYNKRTFVLRTETKRVIFIDKDSIVLMIDNSFQDRRVELTEMELKVAILFLKLEEIDHSPFNPLSPFNISAVAYMIQELKDHLEVNKNNQKRNKMYELLKLWDEVTVV